MTGPILITGANGLIGEELLCLLRRESARVVTTGRSGSGHTDHDRCDLSAPGEAAALIEAICPGTIVHLAGGTSPDRHEVYRKNILPTIHLLNAATRLAERPYCIVMGSAAEYGEGSGEPITESSPLRPVSDYGRAKLAQTTLAESICASAGLPLTVLRPFNLVSSRQPASTALGNMREQLLRGEGRERVVACGRLDVVRDFVPVSAVAETIRRLTMSPVPGQAINVCSGTGIELGAILQATAARLGVAVRIVQEPGLLAIPAARWVVGDPTRLARLTGIRIAATAEELAEILLGQLGGGAPS
jgi:nucleoside-diphosphate-sugar epimerase